MSGWLIQRFSQYGEHPFLAHAGKIYSYADLAEKIASFTTIFSTQGLHSGDVVTLESDYSLSGIAALFALFQLNAIVAPIAVASIAETKLKRTEARANWSLCLKGNLDNQQLTSLNCKLPPHELVTQLMAENHSGLILFSSGSTGRPKAMVHNVDQLLEQFSKKRSRRLSILIFLLFDHIGGLNTLFNGLASRALIVVPPNRDPDVVGEAIQHHQVNLLPASPTFLNLLLIGEVHKRYDLSSLRFITYGTEPMPESLLLRLKKALPATSFIQTFGTSETGISQTISRSSSSTQIKINDPNTESKIVAGELWLRSRSQILGYLNHDMSRFTDDGWFKTGDIVEEDNDGFLIIKGRREDIINVGGEKVTPSEIESTLMEISEIADCTVYGENNAITGQNVAAEIVAKNTSDQKALKRKIKQHCRKILSPYKVPARITFTEKTTVSERFKKNRLQ